MLWGPCLAQFSLNNVHKRGLKHHHFIYGVRVAIPFHMFSKYLFHAIVEMEGIRADPLYPPHYFYFALRGTVFKFQ